MSVRLTDWITPSAVLFSGICFTVMDVYLALLPVLCSVSTVPGTKSLEAKPLPSLSTMDKGIWIWAVISLPLLFITTWEVLKSRLTSVPSKILAACPFSSITSANSTLPSFTTINSLLPCLRDCAVEGADWFRP
ncbi:hypothetical protein D3C81_1768690 [compost metagenome]